MRTAEWQDCFETYLEALEPEVRELVLSGDIEICPCCDELSAYAWQESNAYDQFSDGIVPGGFVPESGAIAHVGTSSGLGEWECGHCHVHLVESDSVLLGF
jgi:hypothetical protein